MPVFVLSCTVGRQLNTRVRFVNIAWIPAGALLPVSGQVRFVMTGFVFLLESKFGECGKTSQKIGWMKSHLKLDAMTHSMCLTVQMVGAAVTREAEILTDLAARWTSIVHNGCLAFSTNVTVSSLTKECSASAFISAGLVGNGDVCDALECAVAEMKKGERAVLTVPASTSEAQLGLRDFANSATLTLELLDFDTPKSAYSLSEQEKVDLAAARKDVNAGLFKSGRTQLALRCYSKVTELLNSTDHFEEAGLKAKARECKKLCDGRRCRHLWGGSPLRDRRDSAVHRIPRSLVKCSCLHAD